MTFFKYSSITFSKDPSMTLSKYFSKTLSKYFYRLSLCLCSLMMVFSFASQTAFAQKEKLGIVKYTPPPGWNKTQTQPNVIAFSILNQTTGAFCIITLYGATAGTGNPKSDFTREWNTLVVQTMKAEANPQTESEEADGWTGIGGGGAVEFGGTKAIAFLTVISGFGKAVSVLGVTNDQSYVPQFQAFITGIEMDKTVAASPAIQTDRPATQNSGPGQPGQSGSFGSMTYKSPAGWSEQKYSDGVIFKPLDLTGELLMMQIMPPLNASGTLEQAMAQSFDEAAAMFKATKMYQAGGNYSKNAAQRSFNGWEYIRGKGGVQVENGTPYKTELGLELFVVKVNNRFERVAILESRPSCQTYSQRYYSSDRIAYRNGIENLLFSLNFADLNETGLKSGSANGKGVVGVWQGTSQSTGSGVGVRLGVFSPIFLSNGQVYYGQKFPTQGLDGLNTRIPPELHPRDWGTYTFTNGRGVMKMPYGEIPIRMEGNRLVVTRNQMDWSFIPLSSVDGATFNGTYVLGAVNGRIPAITFSSDGRFTDNGALKVMHHDPIDCANPAATPGSGTYEVRDYSVIFNYSDGRNVKLAFLGAEYSKSNPSPATLRMSFNEDKLVRQ